MPTVPDCERGLPATPRRCVPLVRAGVRGLLRAAAFCQCHGAAACHATPPCTESHLTLPADATGWQPFGDGVAIKILHEDGAVMSYLLRLTPGAALPPHRHPVDEVCVVPEGEVCIGSLRIGAGGFHVGRKGVLHDRLHSPLGALVFLRGAVPQPDMAI